MNPSPDVSRRSACERIRDQTTMPSPSLVDYRTIRARHGQSQQMPIIMAHRMTVRFHRPSSVRMERKSRATPASRHDSMHEIVLAAIAPCRKSDAICTQEQVRTGGYRRLRVQRRHESPLPKTRHHYWRTTWLTPSPSSRSSACRRGRSAAGVLRRIRRPRARRGARPRTAAPSSRSSRSRTAS